ncbi:unnamed protein product [Polarella glacialis]|uniref:DUS-like FMN-binding domain-containing protein n=1 Tax=Polarella glacialis TaxID=89957 RepID=A0A813G774_POLGL|nr:unnamed protein product [Polarella glacialis]
MVARPLFREQTPRGLKPGLGVDNQDSPEFTREFVRTVAQGGCKHFVIHARKAWLNGLSPAQNRSVPPLHYPRVLDLCREFPDLNFSLNGGVSDMGHARALLGFPGDRLAGETEELTGTAWGWPGSDGAEGLRGPLGSLPSNFSGVMIGRGAMNTPCMLWDVDHCIYGDAPRAEQMTRRQLLEKYRVYLEEAHPDGASAVGPLHMALKPTLGVMAGLKGNKAFRNTADSLMRIKETRELGPAHVLEMAMKAVDEANPGVLDEPLSRTEAYKPAKDRSSGASDGHVIPKDRPGSSARGLKRKGVTGSGGDEVAEAVAADGLGDAVTLKPVEAEQEGQVAGVVK